MSLANTFGIVLSSPVSSEIVSGNGVSTVQKSADDDYEFARTNLRQLIATSVNMAQDASLVAQTNQHANGYVAAAQAIKVALDANKDLLSISKTRIDIAMADGSGRPLEDMSGATITNNNVFVGTTADLLDMMKVKDVTPE